MNPYINYYNNQVGTGLSAFQGTRYQRGHGFFGRLFSGIGGFLKDLIPSLGKRALPSAINFAQDIIGGENVLKSAKSRLKEASHEVADETLDQLKNKLQKGNGRKRQYGSGIPIGRNRQSSFMVQLHNKKRKTIKFRKRVNKRKRKTNFK